jgi:pilus assembly protein Flp/PilA
MDREIHAVIGQEKCLSLCPFFPFKRSFDMKSFLREFRNFTHDESGATAIEYGLLAALVALGITVGATALGTELGLFFGRIATRLSTAA